MSWQLSSYCWPRTEAVDTVSPKAGVVTPTRAFLFLLFLARIISGQEWNNLLNCHSPCFAYPPPRLLSWGSREGESLEKKAMVSLLLELERSGARGRQRETEETTAVIFRSFLSTACAHLLLSSSYSPVLTLHSLLSNHDFSSLVIEFSNTCLLSSQHPLNNTTPCLYLLPVIHKPCIP